jgi:hypothetical protein
MSDARRPDPDADLLEFLGDIDEANDETGDGSFADFLAGADIEKIVAPKPPKARPPEEKHE